MASKDVNTTLKFNADVTDFSKAMQEATRLANRAKSEFDVVASTMDDWSSSTDGLTAKLSQLDAEQKIAERRLEILQEAYAKVVDEQGENSKAAVELETKINRQKAAVNKTAREHDKFAQKLEEVESGADDAADDVKKAGDAAKKSGENAEDAGGGWTIFKDVIADMVSNVISGAVDAIMNAAEATRQYRREMAQFAQNANGAGADMDSMKDTLADVASVTGETDAAMEGLNMLMASGLDTSQIAFAADALSGAATKFDGVKFEGIAEGLQETLATGAAVGPFAEIIERSGGNLETFNEKLAACSTEAEKQQYVMQWLADSGLKDVHDAYVQNNADLVAAEKAQFRTNEAMAAVGAAIEPIQTALTNLGATILEKIAPVITNIVQWTIDNLPIIEPIVTGLAVALGVLAAALGIQSLISGVQKAFALLNTTLLANPIVLIVALIAGLVTALATAYNTSETFRETVNNAWNSVKEGVGIAIEWVGEKIGNLITWFIELPGKIDSAIAGAVQNVTTWGTNVYNAAKTKVTETIDGVVAWFKELPGKIASAISGAVQKVTTWGTNVYNEAKAKVTETIDGVVTWFKELPGKIASAISGAVDSIVQWGSDLVSKGKTAASDLVSAVVSGVTSLPGEMLAVGSNLVSGLWNGISGSFEWIKGKISGWVGDVLGFIKNLFGIHSPSTETEWQGEQLVAGYVKALRNGRREMATAMQGLVSSGLDSVDVNPTDSGRFGGAGGKTIIFNQTNNSPRALSRREIYRQTHNALARVGGA